MVFQPSDSVPISKWGVLMLREVKMCDIRKQLAASATVGVLSMVLGMSEDSINVSSLSCLPHLSHWWKSSDTFHCVWALMHVCTLFPMTAVPPLATNSVSPSLALLANNLSMPTSDLPPGASPRKKPRKQQHVISTEEGDMMETNSTDDEKSTAKSLLVKAEKRKSPPKEYIGNAHLS